MKGKEQPIRDIPPNELLDGVGGYHRRGYRLVQICCTKLGEDSYEMTYSFDREYDFANLRTTVAARAEIPSVTDIYRGAFLMENEIRELFGINIIGINVDYKGHLYKKKAPHPFGPNPPPEGKT
jgi:ech hydrogenase subunit D